MSYFQEKRGKVGEVLEREGVNGISLKELGARALPLVDRTQFFFSLFFFVFFFSFSLFSFLFSLFSFLFSLL